MAGHYKTIDVRIPGLDRKDNRLVLSSGTNDPMLVYARRAMVRELAVRVGGLDLLRGLYDRRFTVAELHRAYLQGPDALAKLGESHKFIPLREAIDGYMTRCRARTADRYRVQLVRFADFLGAEASLADVTTKNVQRFLSQLTAGSNRKDGTPVSDATRNRYRAAISGLCSDAIRVGTLKEHPLAWRQLLPYDEGHRRLPDMSPVEYQRYLDFMPTFEHRVLAELLIHTGADVGEVCDLRADECMLDRDLARLRFKRTKVRRSMERLVPLPERVAGDLRSLLAAHGVIGRAPVFSLSRRNIRSWHERARDDLKRPDLRLKDLRHIAAIYWRRAGVDLERIREWLGLTNMQQVQVYAAFGPDDTFDAPKVAKATELLTLVK